MEQQQPEEYVYLEGRNLNELLDQLRALPADTLGPSFAQVREAFAECLAASHKAMIGERYFEAGVNSICCRSDGETLTAQALERREGVYV